MVAGTKDLRHRDTADLGRLRELWILQQPVTEGLVLAAGVITEGSRQESHHRLDDTERREFSAGQHEVAHRDLIVDREICLLYTSFADGSFPNVRVSVSVATQFDLGVIEMEAAKTVKADARVDFMYEIVRSVSGGIAVSYTHLRGTLQ